MTTGLEIATELINEIAKSIVHDSAYIEVDWEALALVANIVVEDDGTVVKMHGYTYLGDGGIEATTPEGFVTVADLFKRLWSEMLKTSPNGRVWKSALVQIRRSTGKVNFLFELDDADRWAVKPDNYQTMREALRPE